MHSLRAYAFFKDEIEAEMGPLDVTDPKSINRIKDEMPAIRGKAKAPSFAMAYSGGVSAVQRAVGCSKEEAQAIYDAYHELYKITAKYNEDIANKAKRDGYVTGAFGLRLRVPKINHKDEGIAASEARTAGNMTIQSYGMLMNLGIIEFQNRIERDGMVDDVIVFNQVHDCCYGICKNTAPVVKWVNDNLTECMVVDYMEKQLIHNEAELDLGFDMAYQYTLSNDMSEEAVQEFLWENSLQ